jgi:hypothetical protein
MLDDPTLAYQRIGDKFGLTRQHISKLAKGLGINGRQRQRQRTPRREPRVIEIDYPRRLDDRILPHQKAKCRCNSRFRTQ